MEIKPKVTEFPFASDFCESESLPQVLESSLKCENEVKERVGKKRQSTNSSRRKESSEESEFKDTSSERSLSVRDKKGICRSRMKLSHLPLLLCDKETEASSLEQLTSSPQNHSNSKIKMQHMKRLPPEQDADKSRLEHFKTYSPDQGEGLYLEHYKLSLSDQCTSRTRLHHVDSASCAKCTKECKREQLTLSSFKEKAIYKSKMASEQSTLLVVNDKQSPCLSARIEAEHFGINDTDANLNQLRAQDKTEELEIQNCAITEDLNCLEYSKAISNSSHAPHCSRLTDASSIIPIHSQNQCEYAVVNKSSMILSASLCSAQKSPRSVPMREAVDPSKYTRVPDGDGFKFKCSSCGNVYKWRKSLNKHWKEKHDMPWFRSTTVTGIDRKLLFPVNVNSSTEGSSLQDMTSTSAEYTRRFPYSFYDHSSQMPFSTECSPSTSMWNLRLADPMNFRSIPRSALLSGLSENGSVINLQMHDRLGRHEKEFYGTGCPSSHSKEQVSARDLLLKKPSSDTETSNIQLIPQVTARSDKASAVFPDRSCSSDQLVDCILDLSNKGQECVLTFPYLSSPIQEYPLDLSMKFSSQRSVLQKNVTKKTKHTATGSSNMGTTAPGMSVEGAHFSNQSKTWAFCSRCSLRFSSEQGLNLHLVRNHLEYPIEQSDGTGNTEKNILPKIDQPICSQRSMYQSCNGGNTCFVCSVCFLTVQKLALHFDKDHRHIRPNPYQACLYSEDPVPNVPHVDKNFHKASPGFDQQYDRTVVRGSCFRDQLNPDANEPSCSKNLSNEMAPLKIGLVANRTVSSFSEPSGMQTEDWSHELKASQDGMHNSDLNQRRRCASLSCIGLQDQTMPLLQTAAAYDASNLCESSIAFSYDALPDAGTLPSFTDIVAHDPVLNSETLTTLCKVGTHDIVLNAVNLTLSKHVTYDTKRNAEKTKLFSTREMKRGLGKTARNGRKDTGTGDKNLRYKCDFCEFRARWPSEMTQHKKNHSTDKPFKCNHCSYKSKWKWDVRKHLKRCGSEHQRLKKGADAVHELEPVAASSDSSSIQKPSQTAAGESMDLANTSDARDRYTKRSALKRSLHHLVQQDMETSVGRFSLDNHAGTTDRVAGVPVADTANTDKGHSCIHCAFICKSPMELKHHARVHLHLKPYTCKMCCYSTKWKSDLKKHMRTLSHELEGARRSAEALPSSSGYSVWNHAVCPHPRNVESKENSDDSTMMGEKLNDAKKSRRNFGRIAFLDGRLQCRFCNYSSIEITLSQNHQCLSKDRKTCKEGFDDQLAFWEHLGLRKRTWDELNPGELMKLVDVVGKLEEAVPGMNLSKVSSQTITCSASNGNISTNSPSNLKKVKLYEDRKAFCVTSITDFKVDRSCHGVHEG